MDQTVIRAPFDGVVLTKNANVGDTITPFSSALDTKGAVVTMADMSTLEVEADVSEANLQKVKVGQPCEIELDAVPDVRFPGSVSRMVPTVDRSKATVMTKISFRSLTRAAPDMSAKVAFLSEEVPPDQRTARPAVNPAAVPADGRSMVFVLRGDKVRQRADRAQDGRSGRSDARLAARRQGRAVPMRGMVRPCGSPSIDRSRTRRRSSRFDPYPRPTTVGPSRLCSPILT